MLLVYGFHLQEQIDDDDFCSFRPIFIFQTVFLILHLEQPMAITDPFFLRMFFPFFRLFFTFSDNKLLLQCFGFVLIDAVSGCLWLLGTQLHIRDSGCASKGCCWHQGWQFPGSQASRHFLCQYFSRHLLLLSTFPLAARWPLGLLTSRVLLSSQVLCK